jgi:hypothetical protein
MKRMILAAVAALVLAPGVSHAQLGPYVQPMGTNPYQRPTISPYLNMIRPGTNPALNYYGLVRPQMQAMRSMQVFQQDLNTVANMVVFPEAQQTGPQTNLPITGHSVSFYNYSTYFPLATSTGGRGTLGGTTPGSRPQFGSLGGSRPPSRSMGPR